jgi:predicted nucleic acid-binding protein
VTADWTIDANIPLYAIDTRDPIKWARAKDVMAQADRANISIARQTIGEFFFASVRKNLLPRSIAAETARGYLAGYDTFAASHDALAKAIAEAATGRTQFWDALVLAACAENGIRVLLTEDMAEGRHALGVEIVDPFKPGPAGRKTLKKLGIAAR